MVSERGLMQIDWEEVWRLEIFSTVEFTLFSFVNRVYNEITNRHILFLYATFQRFLN